MTLAIGSGSHGLPAPAPARNAISLARAEGGEHEPPLADDSFRLPGEPEPEVATASSGREREEAALTASDLPAGVGLALTQALSTLLALAADSAGGESAAPGGEADPSMIETGPDAAPEAAGPASPVPVASPVAAQGLDPAASVAGVAAQAPSPEAVGPASPIPGASAVATQGPDPEASVASVAAKASSPAVSAAMQGAGAAGGRFATPTAADASAERVTAGAGSQGAPGPAGSALEMADPTRASSPASEEAPSGVRAPSNTVPGQAPSAHGPLSPHSEVADASFVPARSEARSSGDAAGRPAEGTAQTIPDHALPRAEPTLSRVEERLPDAFAAPSTAAASGAGPAAATGAGGGSAAVIAPVPLGAVAVEIGLRTLAGVNHFQIRLDPEDLGAVEVRIAIEGGEVKAQLVVDRVETLNLLQREAKTLERAFEQAGLKPSEGGIDLSLRDPQGEGRGQGRPDERGLRREAAGERPDHTPARDEAPPAATPILWRPARGVDLRI